MRLSSSGRRSSVRSLQSAVVWSCSRQVPDPSLAFVPSSPRPVLPSSPRPVLPSSHRPVIPSSSPPVVPSSGPPLVPSSVLQLIFPDILRRKYPKFIPKVFAEIFRVIKTDLEGNFRHIHLTPGEQDGSPFQFKQPDKLKW